MVPVHDFLWLDIDSPPERVKRRSSARSPYINETLHACAVAIVVAIASSALSPVAAVAALKTQSILVAGGTDGIVFRGTWRARVTIGTPAAIVVDGEAALHSFRIERHATTLTIVQSRSNPRSPEPQIRVTLARLRGVATSGSVDLTLDDRSDAPLFMDLSGTGSIRATGSVPLLRVTTSGSVDADLSAMTAPRARVHARQTSRLMVGSSAALTIVAVDAAHVTYRRATRVAITRRNHALVTRR